MARQALLAAFMTREQVLAHAQQLSAMPDADSKAEFWAAFQRAQRARQSLEPASETPPTVLPLPSGAADHLKAVSSSEAFQEDFGGLDYMFASVPLNRVSPLQTSCFLEPRHTAPDLIDFDRILEYTLPASPTVRGDLSRIPQGVRFSSPAYGLGSSIVRRRVRDSTCHLTFEHVNLVQVLRFGNSLVLANGVHRCLELLRRKTSEVPAIVVSYSDPGRYAWPTGLGYWAPQFLLSNSRNRQLFGPRPPFLSDFLTDLAIECDVFQIPSIIDVTISAAEPIRTIDSGPK